MFLEIPIINKIAFRLRDISSKVYTCLLLVFPIFLFGQNTNNPFEIISKLDPVVQKNIEEKRSTGAPINPFDVVKERVTVSIPDPIPSPTNLNTPILADNNPTLEMPKPERGFRRFLFLTILGMLVLLVLILTLFRNYMQKTYQAFLNENLMNQVYREKEGSISFPYHILYALFFLNGGIFLMWLSHQEGIEIASSHFLSLVYCILGVAGFFLFHHFILALSGFIFPISKDTSRYSFTIQVFNIIIGILLVPLILLSVYGPESMTAYLLPAALLIISGVYLYRYLRGLFIANRYIAFHKFHFLLYICAVEIVPIVILIKLINQTGA